MTTHFSASQNRIIAPICLGLTLLLGIFFLRPAYATYIEKKSILASLQREHTNLDSELIALNAIKNNIASVLTPEKLAKIEKLSKKYDSTEVMSIVMLNDFTKDTQERRAPIEIASISVSKGKKLPNGLSLGSASISLKGKSIADIVDYITYLTQSTPYVFTLDNISLPIDTAPEEAPIGTYGLSITLGVYHYE